MRDKREQYARKAARWSDAEYADARAYLEHRAALVATLGVRLRPGDEVLDLACGDAGLGTFLVDRGFRYRGVDGEPAMAEAARSRLGEAGAIDVGDLNDYVPTEPVAATTLFRALYYVTDRPAFLTRVAGFTERKLVFDVNPRQYALPAILEELRAAGLPRIATRPFFVPQTIRLPAPAGRALQLAERSGPLARLALRWRFTVVVAASPS